jgi:hypothetical protein
MNQSNPAFGHLFQEIPKAGFPSQVSAARRDDISRPQWWLLKISSMLYLPVSFRHVASLPENTRGLRSLCKEPTF